ncbi:large ribosomal subunit protein bL32m-like [Branchiostoma floridae x Branchiostoma japonicum]
MATSLLRIFHAAFQNVEIRLLQAFGLHPPPGPALAIPGCHHPLQGSQDSDRTEPSGLSSLLGGVFLMAAPKHRQSLERRQKRQRHPDKLIKPKENLFPCPECGSMMQEGFLCINCYQRIKYETDIIRQKIKETETDGLASTAETVVRYADETITESDKSKRVIEMARKKPHWFTKDMYDEHWKTS